MSNYRRKPDIVAAIRFDPDADEWPDGVWGENDAYKIGDSYEWRTIKPGQWVLYDKRGDVTILTDEEFGELYERAD